MRMRKMVPLVLISSFSMLILIQCAKKRLPYDYVNPFIGTSGDHGQLFPGALLPYGMVKLSPDTYPSAVNKQAHSGYNYLDEKIMGFSHVRLGGEGCSGAGGNILVLPSVAAKSMTPDKYATTYDKNSEIAHPGFYGVTLMAPEIRCELTTTVHAGLQRFVFPKSKEAHIMIDLGRGFTEVRDASLKVTAPDKIEGHVTAGHLCGSPHNYTIYFSAQISTSCAGFSLWQNEALETGKSEVTGNQIGVILDYQTHPNEAILVKVGLSIVDAANARKNLDAEIPDWDFDTVRDQARAAWERVLNKINVEGSNENKQLFYTALYHSVQMPVSVTDIDGRYRGTDNQVHEAKGYTYYNSYSIWDDFRTKYPLLSLIEPAVLQDIVRSLVNIYEQGTRFWPFVTVRREHMISIITDAFAKGIRDFDTAAAYTGMSEDAYKLRAELESDDAVTRGSLRGESQEDIYLKYDRLGYFPKRPDRTLENCYDNWCVAQMAKMLGKMDDYQKFTQRAQFYRNVWDASIGFFRARDEDGSWLEFPDPTVIDETCVYEATMWQWRWFVLHDVPGLIDLVGGKEKFVADLDHFFSNDLYNAANEQDLHTAFLFNDAGAPWLTQKWVRQILAEPMTQLYGGHAFYNEPYFGRIYRPTPDGYLPEMDDDCGSMASWFVLASMGLYPVCPGQPIYQLTAPLFDRVVIHFDDQLEAGKAFVIEAKNLSAKNIYIQSAQLNGAPYNKAWIAHADIIKGGTLTFEMGAEPNKSWGVTAAMPF